MKQTALTMYQNLSKRIDGFRPCYFIYFAIFLEIIWITSYYLSPAGKSSMNSDLTTGIQMLEQVLQERTLYPKNWVYANTISFPITMPSMILLYKITGDYITALLLNFVVYIIFMVFSVWYFTCHVMEMNRTLTAATIFILLSPGSFEYFNDVFYSGYSYRIAVFLLLLGTGLQCVRNSSLDLNKKYLCLYTVFVFLFVTGDIRYAATIILPLIAAAALSYLLEHGQDTISKIFLPLKNFILYLLATGVTVCICIAVEKYLKSKRTYIEGYYDAALISDLADMWKNLKYMISAYIGTFGYAAGAPQMSVHSVLSLCGLVFAAYIVVVNPVMMLANYYKLPFILRQMILYRWIGYAVTIYFWLFTSGIVFRHALAFLVLDIILAVYYLADKILCDGKVIKVFGCAVLLAYMVFNWSHAPWLNIYSQWNSSYEVLENRNQIIERIKEKGLTYGYASYWTASITAAFSQGELKIYPWSLYDRYKWYAPDELYLPADQKEPTFLLMPQEEYEEYLEVENFENLWGDYKEKIEESGYVLLIYDYNIATNFREFCSQAENLLKHMAIPENNNHTALEDSSGYGQKVILLEPQEYIFGPYLNLMHGSYTLHVETSGKGYLNAYAISAEDGQMNTISQAELKEGKNQVSFFLFENLDRVEFNISNTSDKAIEIRKLSLVQEDSGLLGRMHVSSPDKKNTADSVYLASGEEIYGPYMEAEAGSYMLKVTVSEPVGLHIWTQGGKNPIMQQELSAGENQVPFELSENVPDLEFVIRNSNQKELEITGLQVEKN